MTRLCAGRRLDGYPCHQLAMEPGGLCHLHRPGYMPPVPRHAHDPIPQPSGYFFFVLPDAAGDGWRLSPRGVPV